MAPEHQGGTRVAVACQGGGSHTAFTAGVLRALLTGLPDRYQITALSGASGGAVCALLAWQGLIKVRRGEWDAARAADSLADFWADNSARLPWEVLWNELTVRAAHLHASGLCPAMTASPYSPQYDLMTAAVRLVAPRRQFVDFAALLDRHIDTGLFARPVADPRLMLGAVDILSGAFQVFDSRRVGDEGISLAAVRASCALPSLFPAVEIGRAAYWDGMFSQNPPIREFVQGVPPGDKPHEIWVVRINPQQWHSIPKTLDDIEDRRNELAGNISLQQELFFINKVNQWLAAGVLAGGDKHPVAVHCIEMSDEVSHGLDYASKLNRDEGFLRRLLGHGEEKGAEFLRGLAG